jgi:plasmid stability protein
MRITIENIPDELEKALRLRAEAEGKSVNQLALEALQAAAGMAEDGKKRDFSGVAGSWVEEPVFSQVRNAHEQIDPDRWK